MLSKSYILIQFGFVLAFGVLLDTFIVRTLLVPSFMSFAEKYSWWPSRPPFPDKIIKEKGSEKEIKSPIASGD